MPDPAAADAASTVAPSAAPASAARTKISVKTLDFSKNLIASPAPPGNLTAQNAPQIVVFGWDDIESTDATTSSFSSIAFETSSGSGPELPMQVVHP